MIIGIGTGRNGSTSLSHTLNTWHEYRSVYFPARPNPGHTDEEIDKWRELLKKDSERYNKTYGDVAFQHVHWLDYWVEQDDVELIWCWREREPTVKSILNHHSPYHWELAFPLFDFETEEGVGEYWDWYDDQCAKHEDRLIIIHPSQLDIEVNKTDEPLYEQVLTKVEPPALPEDFQKRLDEAREQLY